MFVAADPTRGDRSPDDFVEIGQALERAAEDFWCAIGEELRFGLFLKGVVPGVEFFAQVFVTETDEGFDFRTDEEISKIFVYEEGEGGRGLLDSPRTLLNSRYCSGRGSSERRKRLRSLRMYLSATRGRM